MDEAFVLSTEASLPPIVTVGRHRIGRVLDRVADSFEGQARIERISASFDTAVDAVLALHARAPIDALVMAGASGAWIRQRVDIPVAMIEVRGFDLLGRWRAPVRRRLRSGAAGRRHRCRSGAEAGGRPGQRDRYRQRAALFGKLGGAHAGLPGLCV